jgi:hypothetical protein
VRLAIALVHDAPDAARSSSDVPEAFRVSIRTLCVAAAPTEDDAHKFSLTAGDMQVDNHCAETAERVPVALCMARARRPPPPPGASRRPPPEPVAVSLVWCVQPACVMQLPGEEAAPRLASFVASCELVVQPLVVSLEDVMLYEWAACVAGLAAAAAATRPPASTAPLQQQQHTDVVAAAAPPHKPRPLFIGRLLVGDISITATLQATQSVYFSVNKMPVSLSQVSVSGS